MKLKVLLLVLALVGGVCEAKDIYLLFGQSNMAGRGSLDSLSPRIPTDRVEKLDKSDKWVEAVEPLHYDKPSAGAGLGATFARILADRDRGVTIGLVPCAVGGSALDEWMPGAPLYTEAMRRAKIAQKDGEIKAILWHQGESDADRAEKEFTYNTRLAKMVSSIRKELGLDERKVPFIYGAIGEFAGSPYLRGNMSFNAVQRHAVELIPNSAFVEAADLVSLYDHIHFDAASVHTLGERYARAYLKLAKGEELRLKNVFSDHMLFQREKPIVVSGWAEKGKKVTVAVRTTSGLQQEGTTSGLQQGEGVADERGEWKVTLPAMKAGGPYVFTITDGKSTLTLEDVLIGELWICSGQSNMEMPIWSDNEFYRYPDGEKVAAAANDPLLRLFKVEREWHPQGPAEDVMRSAGWLRADNPGAVKPFSATGYFFGKELRKRLGDVPVGLVGAYFGASPIRAWIPLEKLRAEGFADFVKETECARDFRPFNQDGSSFLPKVIRERYDMMAKWFERVDAASGEEGAKLRAEAMKVDYDDSGWNWKSNSLAIPGPSVVWYRWHLKDLPSADEVKALAFHAAHISDTDMAWFDGEKIGETDQGERFHWLAKRIYPIKGGKGDHVLTLRVFDHYYDGGITAPVIYWQGGKIDLAKLPFCTKKEIEISRQTGIRPISAWGEGDIYKHCDPVWNFRLGSTLFNQMAAPFRDFPFTGIIWYQGCAETDSLWGDYDRMQRALVTSWREWFGNPDMAFICTQLAGFEVHHPAKPYTAEEIAAFKPRENGYVFIRPEQEKIRSMKGCECATAVDIGDPGDIHPKNKPEVGRRLEKCAENLCYGGKNAVQGPKPVKAERKGAAVEVTFDSDLRIKDGAFGTQEFTLAGKDGKRFWAKAEKIGPRTVRVVAEAAADGKPQVAEPVRVDYGWVPYSPKLSIFNTEDFPAAPFKLEVR